MCCSARYKSGEEPVDSDNIMAAGRIKERPSFTILPAFSIRFRLRDGYAVGAREKTQILVGQEKLDLPPCLRATPCSRATLIKTRQRRSSRKGDGHISQPGGQGCNLFALLSYHPQTNGGMRQNHLFEIRLSDAARGRLFDSPCRHGIAGILDKHVLAEGIAGFSIVKVPWDEIDSWLIFGRTEIDYDWNKDYRDETPVSKY
jgi:hypothetical protein